MPDSNLTLAESSKQSALSVKLCQGMNDKLYTDKKIGRVLYTTSVYAPYYQSIKCICICDFRDQNVKDNVLVNAIQSKSIEI